MDPHGDSATPAESPSDPKPIGLPPNSPDSQPEPRLRSSNTRSARVFGSQRLDEIRKLLLDLPPSSSDSSSTSSTSFPSPQQPLADAISSHRSPSSSPISSPRTALSPSSSSDLSSVKTQQQQQKEEEGNDYSDDVELASALLARRRLAEERMFKRGSAFMIKRMTAAPSTLEVNAQLVRRRPPLNSCSSALQLKHPSVSVVQVTRTALPSSSSSSSTTTNNNPTTTPNTNATTTTRSSLNLTSIAGTSTGDAIQPQNIEADVVDRFTMAALPEQMLDPAAVFSFPPAPEPPMQIQMQQLPTTTLTFALAGEAPRPPPPPLDSSSSSLSSSSSSSSESTSLSSPSPSSPSNSTTSLLTSPSRDSSPVVRWVSAQNPTLKNPKGSSPSLPYDQLILTSDRYVVECIEGNPLFASQSAPYPLIDNQRYTPFFEQYIYAKPHTTYMSYLGESKANPLFISVASPSPYSPHQRVLIRTSRAYTEDTDADEIAIMPIKSKRSRAALRTLFPEIIHPDAYIIPLTGVQANQVAEDMLKLEKMLISKTYKFGVVYCGPNQKTENEMLNNRETSPEFESFLSCLGTKTPLLGFQGFRGGLDVTSSTTGEFSYYHRDDGLEIMYHIAPFLPFTPNDDQQLEKKRHIGNDVVVFVFKQTDAPAFDPSVFVSEFNHVFIVVYPKISDSMLCFQLTVVSKDGVHSVEPPIPNPPILNAADPKTSDFLLKKAINSERAAMYAPSFCSKLGRARRMLLENLIEQYSTNNPVPQSMLQRVFRKKSKNKK